MNERFKNIRHVLHQSLLYAREERGFFTLFVIASFIGALTEGIGISLLAPILDASNGSSGFANVPFLNWVLGLFDSGSYNDRVKAAAIALLVIAVARGFLQYFIDSLGRMVPLRLRYRISLRSHLHLLGAPMEKIDGSDIGQLASYVLNLPARIAAGLTAMAQMIWNVVLLFVYLALMIAVSWKMTLAAFVFMAIMTMFLWRFSLGPIRRFGGELAATQERVNQTAYESIDCMKLIRIMNNEQRNAAQMEEAQRRFSSSEIKLSMLSVIPSSVLAASAGVFICLLLYSAASLAPEGSSEWAPVIMLFLFLTFRLLGPVSQINLSRNSISGQLPAFNQLEAFFEYCELNRQLSGERTFERIGQAIELRDVCFCYPKEADRVIRNLNMIIPRGKTIALVGPSGAGKSTVTALLARFHEPDAGAILVDGRPLPEYDLHSWRDRMAFVSQDISIFNASVAENLRIGKPDADEDEMWEALELAAARDFVADLPDGLNTVLGDRGTRLSGGQKQRIAIARAILRNPDFLVLDEATSHLDTMTESAIQRAIDHLARDRTVLIIAHRLSTIRKADEIVVMDGGTVHEQGTHEALLEKRGAYWNLLKHQQLDLVGNNDSDEPHGKPTTA